MSQAPHKPDDTSRAQVSALAVAGVPQESIAKVLGISDKTLRKYYAEEIEIALQKAIGNISNTLVQKAMAGDTASIIFFLKARAGWRDRPAEEEPGKKAKRQANAEKSASGGRFAAPSAPKLVVNNRK